MFFRKPGSIGASGKHGDAVDRSTRIAKLPRNLVERSVEPCPSSILLAARGPKQDIHAEGDRVYFGPGTLPVKVSDFDAGEIRMGRFKDREDFARLIDVLELHQPTVVPLKNH